MSNSGSELSRNFPSSENGKEEAEPTMREMEAWAVSQAMDRQKRKHSSSFGGSKFVENKVEMTPYEDELLTEFEEKLHPKFDLEAFLEGLKAPSKALGSVGGSARNEEAGISLRECKSFKEFEERLPPPKEYSSPAELLEELLAPSPRLEMYAVKLALDHAKWERSGVSISDFAKEEALTFLKDTFGSSGKDKFCSVYEEAGNAFFCNLYEDDLKAILGKDEVVQVKLVDELVFLHLSGFSSHYTMSKKFCFMPENLTVFDL